MGLGWGGCFQLELSCLWDTSGSLETVPKPPERVQQKGEPFILSIQECIKISAHMELAGSNEM